MKTNTVVAFLSVLLVVSYLVVMRIDVESIGEMGKFIPAETLIYVQQREASKALRRFLDSPLGNQMLHLDINRVGERLDLDPALRANLVMHSSQLAELRHNRIVDLLLGKRFSISLLSPRGHQGLIWNGTADFLRANLVVVTEPRQPAGFLEFLAGELSRFHPEIKISSAFYGNHVIRRLNLEKETISLVNIDGFFIAAFNERQLRRCIDAYDGDILALTDSPQFTGMKKRFVGQHRFFYCSLDRLRNVARSYLADREDAVHSLILKELANTEGFSGLGYGSWLEKGRIIDKIVVSYDKAKVNKVAAGYLSIPPQKPTVLGWSSDAPMLYYWSNTLQAAQLFDYWRESLSKGKELSELKARLKKQARVDLEKLARQIGSRLAIIVEKGKAGRYFETPRFMLVLQVKDGRMVEDAFAQLLAAQGIPFTEGKRGGVTFQYWRPSPEDGLRPLYCVRGNLLFLGNSSILLEKLVQHKQQGRTLLDNPRVKRVNPGLLKANNSITYFDIGELAGFTGKVLDVLGTFYAIKDRQAAYRARIIIEELVMPLLDSLKKTYGASASRSYFTDKAVVVESMTSLVGHSAVGENHE